MHLVGCEQQATSNELCYHLFLKFIYTDFELKLGKLKYFITRVKTIGRKRSYLVKCKSDSCGYKLTSSGAKWELLYNISGSTDPVEIGSYNYHCSHMSDTRSKHLIPAGLLIVKTEIVEQGLMAIV